MSWLTKTLTSTLGRKLSMAITGLFLVSFLLVHVAGNIQLFYNDGGYAFNVYTKFMTTNPIIRVMEIVLVAGFVVHIYTAWALTQMNKNARPQKYAFELKPTKDVSWFSRNMGLSGTIVLIFLVVHLQNFWYTYKFGEMKYHVYNEVSHELIHQGVDKDFTPQQGEVVLKDMFGVVATTFKDIPAIAVLYIVAMVLLAFHLNHGFQSAFRTLGIDHKKYNPLINSLGGIVSYVIPALFALMPLYFLIVYKG